MIKIDGSAIKGLEVFMAVIEANGVSNAQSLLNKDASAISRSLSALEARLGLTLCERGRQGFRLTPEGQQVADEALKLFAAFRSFENRTESLGGRGSGRLAIGVIDNIIGESRFCLDRAITELSQYFDDRFHIDLYVKNPYELEKYLLDKRVDIALGIFERYHDGLEYRALYEELDYLYAAPGSPAATLQAEGASSQQLQEALKHQNFAARNFLNESDIGSLGYDLLGDISYTANLEAIAFLVLSGRYVGFMPAQYAAPFVSEGRLTPILPNQIKRVSTMALAYRRGEDKDRPIIATALTVLNAATHAKMNK
ncbi:LysR family transcriptional regulator [Gilvimarinus sp. 1_MG-2023]|uniref:LysR family transcriptional regulator n=1 Tax=Gilvimarinus sp. 1_MG-2023 TaxID=3062638 RepID=UPI0026E33935|nr:LysR family transcriptional regulator [Gilvimarinus sp. 1_MG-2023]MDO6746078.1 LysR family transcriptional regulator [Gilvimarinus sp. 1_MG-2023]